MVLELYTGQKLTTKGASLVTITPKGTIYITAALGVNLDRKMPYVELRYDRNAKLATMTFTAEKSSGSRTWLKPSLTCTEGRFAAKGFLQYYGIEVKEKTSYPAKWIQGVLHVDMSCRHLVEEPAPPAKLMRVTKEGKPDQRHYTPKRRCLGCTDWRAIQGQLTHGFCRSRKSTWRDKTVPATSCCEFHDPRKPGNAENESEIGEDKA